MSTKVTLPNNTLLRVIYAGDTGRIEACRREHIPYLTVENVLEIGDDKLGDLCPFGDTVFRAKDGKFYELHYEPILRTLDESNVRMRCGQRCHPHNKSGCQRCHKGDVGP